MRLKQIKLTVNIIAALALGVVVWLTFFTHVRYEDTSIYFCVFLGFTMVNMIIDLREKKKLNQGIKSDILLLIFFFLTFIVYAINVIQSFM